MLCYVMLCMHGCMYKDVCMYLSHRCICTCVCARACVCVCLSRMCMRMFMEKGGGLGGNGCGEERHMQKVTTMLINEPVDPLTGTLNGVPPPCSRKMSQKRPDLSYRGGTHTHTLSLSVCLSVSLSLSLPPCRGFGEHLLLLLWFLPSIFSFPTKSVARWRLGGAWVTSTGRLFKSLNCTSVWVLFAFISSVRCCKTKF